MTPASTIAVEDRVPRLWSGMRPVRVAVSVLCAVIAASVLLSSSVRNSSSSSIKDMSSPPSLSHRGPVFTGLHNASLPQPHNETLARHEEKLREVEQRGSSIQLVLLGDSITHYWERRGHIQVWEKHFGQYPTLNLGVTGDRTEHVLWRIEQGEMKGLHPKVVVIMIGTNNALFYEPQETYEGIKAIVHKVLSSLRSRILLLAIFPRGNSAHPMRLKNNDVNKMLAKEYGKSTSRDKSDRVVYLDIGSAFVDQKGDLKPGIMPDSLHPNARGYELWAEAMKPTLDRMMALPAAA